MIHAAIVSMLGAIQVGLFYESHDAVPLVGAIFCGCMAVLITLDELL